MAGGDPGAYNRDAMRLFACLCNQPQRVAEALSPVRDVLVAQPPIGGWGLGYVQGGEALLARTPRSSQSAVDLFEPLSKISTDMAVGQAVADSRLSGTENTPPFRFRRWLFVGHEFGAIDPIWSALLQSIPDHIRRNIKGRMSGELILHLLLARLHELSRVDDPNLPIAMMKQAAEATLALVMREAERAHVVCTSSNFIVGNSRSMIAVRVAEPMFLRRLWVRGERTERDESFRGVLLVSGANLGALSNGFEEVPNGQCVAISRELRIDLMPLSRGPG